MILTGVSFFVLTYLHTLCIYIYTYIYSTHVYGYLTLIQTCASMTIFMDNYVHKITHIYLCIFVPCPRYSFQILLGDEKVKRAATFSASGTLEVDSLFGPFTKHLGTFSPDLSAKRVGFHLPKKTPRS